MKRLILLLSISLLISIGYAGKPSLSFFCELQGKEFSELFADAALINQLVEMKAAIRIGLHDFNPERTETIKKLNKAGIPVVAWLLLPEADGYWFNMHNGEKAENRYDNFKKWTSDNNLKWAGIGIDIEPDMNDAKMALKHPWKFAWKVYKRLYDNNSLRDGKELYQRLIAKMKSDGYVVESYIMSFIYVEREKKTTSVQKLLGIIDIEVDKEIPMAYTSAMGNPAIIPLSHRENMPIALGSTGGGVKIEGIELASLTWDELERDLLIASKLTHEVHIFCLESSVQKGFLIKIKNLDFEQKAPDLTVELQKQQKVNGILGFIIIILDHPFWFTIGVLAIISIVLYGVYRLLALILRIFIRKKIKQ
jgi:hypothetical protein